LLGRKTERREIAELWKKLRGPALIERRYNFVTPSGFGEPSSVQPVLGAAESRATPYTDADSD